MKRIRVLLIEDSRLLRNGISALFEKHKDFKIYATSEISYALQKLKSMKKSPNVILLDMSLPKQHILNFIKYLEKECLEIKVIVMGVLPDQVDIIEVMQLGCCGLILTDAPFEVILETIRKVSEGEKVIPNRLMKSLLNQIVEHRFSINKYKTNTLVKLSSREKEIVALISRGMSNKQIANQLQITIDTVKSHVHNILEKLALNTRLEIAVFAHAQEKDSGFIPYKEDISPAYKR